MLYLLRLYHHILSKSECIFDYDDGTLDLRPVGLSSVQGKQTPVQGAAIRSAPQRGVHRPGLVLESDRHGSMDGWYSR